ncbi:MAG: DUF2232 domain-containing protein [Syntrophobacteraceae bacterium]|nr:DUF2232 domain-containing protein [Syntrophobacteraceae bacterium]
MATENGASPGLGGQRGKELFLGIGGTLVFFFSALLIPMVGLFAGIFTPLPTLLFFYRWGPPWGYVIPGGAALLGIPLLMLLDLGYGAPYLLEMLVFGLFLGFGMRRHWSVERVVGSASALVTVMGLLFLWISLQGTEGGFFKAMEDDLQSSITATLQQYGDLSRDQKAVSSAIQKVVPLIVRLFPAIAVSSAILISWMNLLVTRRYCRNHRVLLPPWREWSHWKANDLLVWVVIGAGFSQLLPMGIFRLVGLNVLLVVGTIYLLQGFSIMAFYFDRWNLPKPLRAFLYALLLLQQYLALGAVLFGLFDVWVDFRRLSGKPAEPT